MEFSLSEDKMQGYCLTARQREQQRLEQLVTRRSQGMAAARQAAQILKQMGATRVVLFGSLLTEGFHGTSDLDLAVWDLPEHLYFRAVARLEGSGGFEVDLVEAQQAEVHIAEAIASGMEL